MSSISNKAPELTFKKALAWLGSANAFGWPVIIWIAFWPPITGSIAEPPPGYEMPVSIHLWDLLSGLIPAAIIMLARFVLAANSAGYRVSIARNLLIQLFAAVTSVIGSLALMTLLGPVPAPYFAGIPLGIFSALGQILTYTLVVSSFTDLRRSTKLLAKKTHSLNYLRGSLESRVLEQRAQLNAAVAERLSGELNQLQSQLAALGGDAGASILAERIKDAIDLVVRPLSLEIADPIATSVKDEFRSLRQIERSIRRLPFAQRMRSKLSLGYVFNVPFIALALVIFVISSYAYIFGPMAIWQVAIPATLLTLVSILGANRLTANVQSTYVIAVVEIFIGAALAVVPFAVLNQLVLGDRDVELQQLVLLEVFVVCIFGFYASLFVEVAYLNFERTRAANRELRKLLGLLQNELQINRRTMAQIVHGKIQARLQAASLRLKQADSITDALLAEVGNELTASVLDTTDTEGSKRSLIVQLEQMAEQWAGICEVTIACEPAAAAVADANPVIKSAVVEVVREAVNNAVKHGEADEADGSIRLDADGAIVIVIRNAVYATGSAKSLSGSSEAPAGTGYGSQLLGQITDGWSVSFADGDAIFEAKIGAAQTNL